MSNEDTVRRLNFQSSAPLVEAIAGRVADVLEGERTAEAVLALARIIGVLLSNASPAARPGLIAAVTGAIASRAIGISQPPA
jgi:hypothetical protein